MSSTKQWPAWLRGFAYGVAITAFALLALVAIDVWRAEACSVLCATCKPCQVPKRDPQWRNMCDGERTACGRDLRFRRGLVWLHPKAPDPLVTAPCNCKFELRERRR